MIHLQGHSYNYGVQRGTMNNVYIGRYTSIAEGVIFDGGFNHNATLLTTFPLHKIWSELPTNILVKGDINIGNDVTIGEGAVIMSGVTIGDGAIIGARSIVTKDVEPYNIVVGTPARIARRRFSPYEIEQLLLIRWWDWPDEKVKENWQLLLSDNIHEFIKQHGKQNITNSETHQ